MKSIFWKIFFSFWLIMVLVVGFAVHWSFYLARQRADQFDDVSRVDIVRAVAEVVSEDPQNSFKRWLRENKMMPPGQTIFLISADAKDILDRELPAGVQRGLSRSARQRRHHRAANLPVINAGDGQQYLVMFGPARLPVFGMLSAPGANRTVLLVAILLSAAACYLLTRYLTAPLRGVVVASRALARGEMGARSGDGNYRADELGELSKQFDDMAATLEAQRQSRQTLFRNVSHELRSPLARIQVALALARHEASDMPVQLDRIEHEAEELEALTQQVLGLARAQAYVVDTSQKAHLNAIIAQVGDDASYEGQAKQIQVNWHAPEAAVFVRAEQTIVRSAIENVVRNAVRFTPAQGQIDLELALVDGSALITVSDNGPGVDGEYLEQIFEPFYSIGNHGGQQSSGVGLAITQHVARALGGSVAACNRAEGGLLVTISIPITQSA